MIIHNAEMNNNFAKNFFVVGHVLVTNAYFNVINVETIAINSNSFTGNIVVNNAIIRIQPIP